MGLKTDDRPAILPRIIFRDNQISMPAFQLLDLSDADLSNHVIRGVIRVRVGDFRLKRPRRSVRRFKFEIAHGGEKPSDTGIDMPDPPPLPVRRTLWDIDADPLFDPGLQAPQRVLIRIVLADELDYWPPQMLPAITAKDEASQKGLANLVVDTNPNNLPRASFWALRPAGAATIVQHSFNIAIVAPDETDANFTLPIIIDPSVRNRG